MIVLHRNWLPPILKGTAAWVNQKCPLIVTVLSKSLKAVIMLYIQVTFLSNVAFSLIKKSESDSTHLLWKGKSILFDQTQELWKCITCCKKANNTKKSQQLQTRKREVTTTKLTTNRIHNFTSTCPSLPRVRSEKSHTHTQVTKLTIIYEIYKLQSATWGVSQRCFEGNCTGYLFFVNVTDGKQWKGHTRDWSFKYNREHKLKAKQRRAFILWKGNKQITHY